MKPIPRELLSHFHHFAAGTPPPILETLAQRLAELSPGANREAVRRLGAKVLPTPDLRHGFDRLCDHWFSNELHPSGESVGLALLAVAETQRILKQETVLAPVWTGPVTEAVSLRRTEQVLDQLIAEATSSLLIVSFAVYAVPRIVERLHQALDRGVTVRIIVETPAASLGKISFGAQTTLGIELLNRSEFFIWPLENRPTDQLGRHGSLHAKCALADRRRTLLSSANLTAYAMNLNMEMGVLVENHSFGNLLWNHFDELITKGILERVQ